MFGPEELGADKFNKVLIMDGLLDSKPLFLTGNTSTLYVLPVFDPKTDGATVIEVPKGMLGAFQWDVEHGGETVQETELEPLFRFGTGYWFALNETIAIAPTFMTDVAQGHWTLVYGLSVGVGW